MTPAEAAAVIAHAAAFDNREPSKVAPAAWASALNPRISVKDACWIISDHYSRETWKVMPAHINERYKQVRRSRTQDMHSPEPPAELDGHPAREIEWQRAYRAAIGDGLDAAEADEQACRAVSVSRRQIEAAPRPLTAFLGTHSAKCPPSCGCLTRPIRTEERRP